MYLYIENRRSTEHLENYIYVHTLDYDIYRELYSKMTVVFIISVFGFEGMSFCFFGNP